MKVHFAEYAKRSDITHKEPLGSYTLDHDDPAQRRVLGERCRLAFEAGHTVVTTPIKEN